MFVLGSLERTSLLVLIELFFTRCYGWGATSEYRLKIGVLAPTVSVWPIISGEINHQPFLLSEN